MGIITRLFHQSEGLKDNKYNMFFMDMGEAIHIHYRDLRIELSVAEFIEFAELCEVYLPQVKKEIDGGYQDGVIPNTNQANTWKQFYNQSPLKNKIAYNPNRISLEENTDGYHVHIRNYKILLDKQSFINLAQSAQDVLDKKETDVDLNETLELITINELKHSVDKVEHAGDLKQAVVTVEKPFFRKTVQLLEGLLYKKSNKSSKTEAIFEKEHSRICLKVGATTTPSAITMGDSSIMPLTYFIKKNAKNISPNDFNLLKLQILDFFNFAKKNALEQLVETDHKNLIYDTVQRKVVFPSKTIRSDTNINDEYTSLNTFLNEQGLSFVKPNKTLYSDAVNQRLLSVFYRHITKQLAAHPCVNKIYHFNGELKKKAGLYETPFVHFDWAKLGTDFDILIEIDERHKIPTAWEYNFYSKLSSSFYYHLGEVDFPILSPFIEQFPNINFFHHMIEAYLFFPSKGDKAVKDEYLKKYGASLLYQKKLTLDGTTDLLRSFIEKNYDLQVDDLISLAPPSFNEVYRIKTPNRDYVAKIIKKDDFTPAVKGQSGRHVEYEAKLLQALTGEDMPVVTPIAAANSEIIQEFDGRYCMLLPFVEIDKDTNLAVPKIEAAAKSLAILHKKLAKIDLTTELYRFNEALEYWEEQYTSLYIKYGKNKKRQTQFKSLLPDLKKAKNKILDTKELPWLHCHGDVCPRNFFFVNGEALLFDFQVAHYGPRLEDLAEGALEFACRGSTLEQELIDTFITLYDKENSLTDEERNILPTMLFLQATQKLARFFRIEVLFGFKVDNDRMTAFLEYARTAASKA